MSHFPAKLPSAPAPKVTLDPEFSAFGATKAERRKTSISAAVGKEPKLSDKSTEAQVYDAFNWYSYSAETGDAKKYTLQYIRKTFKGGEDVARRIGMLSDWDFGATGWMARQLLLGNSLPPAYADRFKTRLTALNTKAKTLVELEEKAEEVVAPPTARLFSNQASKIIAELDGQLDDIESKDGKLGPMYEWLTKQTASPNVLAEVRRYYIPLADEYEQALRKGGDEQIIEAYASSKKSRVKKQADFISEVLQAIDRITINKKSARKPRAKKAKSAIQQTKNMKYKVSDSEYKLTSIAPSEAVGTLQLWVFNTKTRMLGVYVASDTSALTVKGTSVQNFVEGLSIQKKLRKPDQVLSQVLGGNKVSLRKIMDGINAKSQPLNGRINSETILLRSIK
jgi:hypothetical protein